MVGQIMAFVAFPMTIVLIVQTLMMLAGFGSSRKPVKADDDDDDDDEFDDEDDEDYDGGDDDEDYDGDDASAGADDEDHGEALGRSRVVYDSDDSLSPADAASERRIGARMLTARGVVAFFAIGGWAGLAAIVRQVPSAWSILIAMAAGIAAMLLASAVIKYAQK